MKIVTSGPEIVRGTLNPVDRSLAIAPWQSILRGAIRDPRALCRALRLDESLAVEAIAASPAGFQLLVPAGYLARIEVGNPNDPLLLQVLPQQRETHVAPHELDDPVGDRQSARAPGLLCKYKGRALLVTTGACAVHCRYCFRRNFPYFERPRRETWEAAIEAIAADRSIREVILSGGDPLTLADADLASLAGQLAAIPHLKRIRVHTRLPIMIPERIDDRLLAWLAGTRLAPVVVLHCNHSNEIDEPVHDACRRLGKAGIPLLNQTVLLRGINDDVQTLMRLSEQLVASGVIPYYLHQLDPVEGSSHFAVPEAEGRRLIRSLRRELPGYAVPRYVRETPGESSKTPIID